MFIGKIILNWLQTQSSDSTNKFHFNFFIISNDIGYDIALESIREKKKNDTIIDQHAGNGIFYTIKIVWTDKM